MSVYTSFLSVQNHFMRIITAGLLFAMMFIASTAASPKSDDDPCSKAESNVDMRTCYTKEQTRVNAEADAVSKHIAAMFRKDAEDSSYVPWVSVELRKAASALTESQRMWEHYRDQYCDAVAYSYTTGSGAGTAYEACMFKLGTARVQELRSDFNRWR